MKRSAIHTIGYEGAAMDDLIAVLKAASVSRIVDIRHSPYSQRAEFSKDELATVLTAYGLAYTHLRELGNPPAGREAARVGHMLSYREIFKAHLDGAAAQAGLDKVLQLAATEAVCLLCLEKTASNCHRAMVADRLKAMSGHEIRHLRVTTRQAHPAQVAFDF